MADEMSFEFGEECFHNDLEILLTFDKVYYIELSVDSTFCFFNRSDILVILACLSKNHSPKSE